MYVSECETRSVSRAMGRRLIGVSLLIAGAILLSTWLRTTGTTGGMDVLVLAAAALVGGWILNARSPVRGLPLAVGLIMAVVTLVGWALGDAGHAVPGATLFMALLLSAVARSWSVGLAATAILAVAQIVAALI